MGTGDVLVNLTQPLGRDNWPIAAAMINFPGTRPDGSSVQDDSPDVWDTTLAEVQDAGFNHLDPTDSWLRLADLSPRWLKEFLAVAAGRELHIRSISTARRSIIDANNSVANLAYSHRVIDTAAEIGATTVSFGLMQALTAEQQNALWFWTVRGHSDPDDDETWQLAVARFRELGEHASSVGVLVSLEMYEDTLLGSADSAVRLIRDIDHPSVGLNPDLGNLLRLHRNVEKGQSMVEKTLPFANYWHVKNYHRAEDTPTGAILTTPAPMESGVLDYRSAIRFALAHGYRGAFCVEHYGGDGLSVSATNRDYIRRLLPMNVDALPQLTVARSEKL